MHRLRNLLRSTDEWIKDLSKGTYAAVIGMSAGIGMLAVGLLTSQKFLFVRASAIALTMFGLEYIFRSWGNSS